MVQSADQVTGALADWLRSRFADIALSLTDAPVADGKGVIRVALADLYVETSGSRMTPATVLRLDYLVTVDAADALLMHRYLGEIAFALAENPVLAIPGADPVVLRMERRGGGPPGIAVSTSLPRLRSLPAAPPVLHAAVVQVGTMGTIEGIVEGPDGRAVAGAVVELPALKLVQTTGTDGRFRFDAPREAARALELTARKQRFSKTVTAEPGQHLTLQLSVES